MKKFIVTIISLLICSFAVCPAYADSSDSNIIYLSTPAANDVRSIEAMSASIEHTNIPGIAGIISDLISVTWLSNEDITLVVEITNTGTQPIQFSLCEGKYSGSFASATVQTNRSVILNVNENDLPKYLRQGVYYSDFYYKAVNANWNNSPISFSVDLTVVQR